MPVTNWRQPQLQLIVIGECKQFCNLTKVTETGDAVEAGGV